MEDKTKPSVNDNFYDICYKDTLLFKIISSLDDKETDRLIENLFRYAEGKEDIDVIIPEIIQEFDITDEKEIKRIRKLYKSKDGYRKTKEFMELYVKKYNGTVLYLPDDKVKTYCI